MTEPPTVEDKPANSPSGPDDCTKVLNINVGVLGHVDSGTEKNIPLQTALPPLLHFPRNNALLYHTLKIVFPLFCRLRKDISRQGLIDTLINSGAGQEQAVATKRDDTGLGIQLLLHGYPRPLARCRCC